MNTKSEILQEEYQKRFQANAEYRDAVWKVLCEDFFAKYVAREAVLLDVGAGWGEFTRNIKAHKKYAMDLNPDCGKRVQGFAEFLHQDCSHAWPINDGSLDVVFTSNFLEHLPNKGVIDSTLSEAFRCLKSGGLFLALGPNIRYLPGAYWDYWDHYIPITHRSMGEALSLQGFEVREVIDRFLPYTMSGGANPPLFAVKAYVRLPLAWRYLGKQFFVVARKP